MEKFILLFLVILIGVLLYFSAIIIPEGKRVIVYTLWKYWYKLKPWLKFVIPKLQTYEFIDIRDKVVDIPTQEIITKDNISVNIDAVLTYRINPKEAEKAIINVEDFQSAISNLAQTTIRSITGKYELDELISKRDNINSIIEEEVGKVVKDWGLTVVLLELKDISFEDSLKRTMGKQAEAEREKRSVITKSEGEVIAAENLRKASEILEGNPWALHLRTLSTLNDISSDQSNTIITVLPVEVLRMFDAFAKKTENTKDKKPKKKKVKKITKIK